MITYKPKHKSHKPASDSLIGCDIRVLTDLNISESSIHIGDDKRKYKKLITRIYSMKHKGKLAGHSSRFIMNDVYGVVSEPTRLKVIEKRSKDPHAYLCGNLGELVANNDDRLHGEIISNLIAKGAVYIAYDPYKVDSFKILPNHESCHLPKVGDAQQLESISHDKNKPHSMAYCFEHGILLLK